MRDDFSGQGARPHFEVLIVSHGAISAYKIDFCKQIVKTSSKAVKMGYQNPDFFHIGEESFSKGVRFSFFCGY